MRRAQGRHMRPHLSRRAFVLLNMGLFLKSKTAQSLTSISTRVDKDPFICSTISLDNDTPAIATGDPSNAAIATDVPTEFEITPFGVATAKRKWELDHGMTPDTGVITLGIHFLNGSNEMQSEVKRRAKGWIDNRLSQKLRFNFGVCLEESQIRLLFNDNKNEAAIGSDALKSKYASSPTMWIKDMRSVTHEFGHALCLRHEHRHSEFPYVFKDDIVIAEMKKHGWKPKDIRRNILNKIADSECIGDPDFNKKSVMLYEIPDHWLESGQALSPNREISQRDRDCVYELYKA